MHGNIGTVPGPKTDKKRARKGTVFDILLRLQYKFELFIEIIVKGTPFF